MRVGSLFSGIGGFDLGLEMAGCEIAWQVESDPFARKVLAARWPHLTCWPDVREWTSDGHESVDLLCGGFPCQDLSIAGQRRGLVGARSGLFHEFIRIAKVLTPTWGLVENVPGLFSSHAGRDMATVLEGLRQCWPVVGYAVLDSQYFGVPQRRRRIFFVGGPSIDRVEQVLVESQSGRRNSPQSDEAGTDLAASLRSRSHGPGINPPGRAGEDDMNIVVSHPLLAKGNLSFDDSLETYVMQCHGSNVGPMGALRAGNGNETGGVPFIVHAPPIAATLNPGHEAKHSYAGGGGRNGCGIGEEGDPMFTLQASKQHGVGVRRLTPTECERLQGFPDGWTCLCQPLESYDANRCTCPDGPRYKTLGNAVTVPVIRWIGQRLLEAL